MLPALCLALLPGPQTVPVAQLPSPVPQQDGHVGWAVALDGSTAIATATGETPPSGVGRGLAHVYVDGGAGWTHQTTLSTAVPLQSNSIFGLDVDLDGDTAVVGVRTSMNALGSSSGAAAVFERGPGGWTETAWLQPGTNGDSFGSAVAISGDWIAVSAPRDLSFAKGAVYLFQRVGGAWNQVVKLTRPGPEDNWFGTSLSLDGTRLAVGEPWGLVGTTVAGAVVVYELVGGSWIETARLTSPSPQAGASLGSAVALDGDLLVGSAPSEDTAAGALSGVVHVFRRHSSGWSAEAAVQPAGVLPNERFGFALDLRTAAGGGVAGASLVASVTSERVHLFRSTPTAWVEEASFTAPNPQATSGFGTDVALQGNLVLAGAPFEDDPAAAGTSEGLTHLLRACPITEPYCTAGTTAAGCQASISSVGTPSATSTSGFSVTVNGAEGSRQGLFLFGVNGRQAAPWGNGSSFQCVVPPVFRGGASVFGGTAGQCDGTMTQDLNALWCAACPKPGSNPGSGTTAQVQAWFRDPLSTSNQSTSLSNALELVLCP